MTANGFRRTNKNGCLKCRFVFEAAVFVGNQIQGPLILKAEEFEDLEWRYERSFTAPKERERVYIVFKGLHYRSFKFILSRCNSNLPASETFS